MVAWGVFIGSLPGIVLIVKNLVFANIAEKVNIIAKNTAENNKNIHSETARKEQNK